MKLVDLDLLKKFSRLGRVIELRTRGVLKNLISKKIANKPLKPFVTYAELENEVKSEALAKIISIESKGCGYLDSSALDTAYRFLQDNIVPEHAKNTIIAAVNNLEIDPSTGNLTGESLEALLNANYHASLDKEIILTHKHSTSFGHQHSVDSTDHYTPTDDISGHDLNGTTDQISIKTESADYVSDVADHHDIASGMLDHVAEIAERLGDIPGLDIAAEALVVTRFITPFTHLAKGEFERARVTAMTRIAEIPLLPGKLSAAVAGLIKGTILECRGITGKGSGGLEGAAVMLKKWNKARRTIEDEILGETGEDLETRLAKAEALLKEHTEQAVGRVRTSAQGRSQRIAADNTSELNAINSATQKAQLIAETERQKAAFCGGRVQKIEDKLQSNIQAIDVRLAELLAEQEKIDREHQQTIVDITGKLDKLHQQGSNTELQGQLEQQFQEAERVYREKLRKLVSNVTREAQLIETYEKIAAKANAKGFQRIAGYEEQVKALLDKFTSPIERKKAGQEVDAPNAILLFGPKGNGKTTLAHALADHFDFGFIKLENSLVPRQDFKNLKAAAQQGRERFLRDGTRSVILIDEFDIFANKGFDKIADLVAFLNRLSRDYHCTLFATTNLPENIAEPLLRDGDFHKIGLPPANKTNAAAILKHYVEDFAEDGVNYEQLAAQVVKVQPQRAFSNSRIASIISDLTASGANLGRKLTQDDIHQAIVAKGPDIERTDLELFNRQLDYCRDTGSHRYTTPAKPTKAEAVNDTEEMLNRSYDIHTAILAKKPEFKGKEALIRGTLPALDPLKLNADQTKAALQAMTPENKDFLVQEGIPAYLRNWEALDLRQDMTEVLRTITPDTVDCLDKLAANKERFKITQRTDSKSLLGALTKENKEFAIEELLPYLADNAEKYRVRRGVDMAKLLKVITPENKDFMLNEALPTVFESADKLNLGLSDVAKVAGHATKDTLGNVRVIADNQEKHDLESELFKGFVDVDKLIALMNSGKLD